MSKSLDPLYTVIYYIKMIKSSWTYCIYCYTYKMIRSGNWSGSWSISGFTTQYLARFCRYREERKRFTLINKDISCYIKRVKTSWTYCRYCYIYRIIRIRLMTRILIYIRIYSTKSLVRKYFVKIERRGEEWICIMYLYFKLINHNYYYILYFLDRLMTRLLISNRIRISNTNFSCSVSVERREEERNMYVYFASIEW